MLPSPPASASWPTPSSHATPPPPPPPSMPVEAALFSLLGAPLSHPHSPPFALLSATGVLSTEALLGPTPPPAITQLPTFHSPTPQKTALTTDCFCSYRFAFRIGAPLALLSVTKTALLPSSINVPSTTPRDAPKAQIYLVLRKPRSISQQFLFPGTRFLQLSNPAGDVLHRLGGCR